MQGIVKRILDEKFDFEYGSLDFSCAELTIELSAGSVYEGSFHMYASEGKLPRGYVLSSDLRMECLTPEFSGQEAEMVFRFHAEDAEAGDVVKGTFSIISNCGEYYLPFEASVKAPVLMASVGEIENLTQFAAFARENWQEAVKLFYSPSFKYVLSDFPYDHQNVLSYQALSSYAGQEQNMEEFLQQAGVKTKVSFHAEDNRLQVNLAMADHVDHITETAVSIVRSGWGYTGLQVTCEGDFLYTEKEFLSDDDFLGNYCRLPVYIDSSRCRNGNHFGKILLSGPYEKIEIPVFVKGGERITASTAASTAERTWKKAIFQLLECYQNFRLKKINSSMWMQETGKLVEHLVSMNENDPAARLFQAQLLITEGRDNEAGWILDHAAEILEQEELYDSPLWAYYLYLTTLLPHEEGYVNEITEEVSLIYRKNRTQWRTAWLLLYLSDEYNRSDSGKWGFLEKQFRYGCSSPILYLEAVQMLNNNPSVLRRLDDFAIQVLRYGARRKVLQPEVVEQLLYLAGKQRDYSPVLERTLQELFTQTEDVRILQELCTMLIKGGKTGKQYFLWYAKSVEAQLRITNLYEYYMMSADLESLQEIPTIVLMYFMYQNNLDYERSAFLYDYIRQHKDQYEELYNGYRPKIQRFVMDQIQKKHINSSLSGLYREMLVQDMVTEQTALSLKELLFAHRITVEDAALWKVLVYQSGNHQPVQAFLQNGKTWVPIYGEHHLVVLEDAQGNRFVKNAEYTAEPLMEPELYLDWLLPYAGSLPELDICMMDKDIPESTEGINRRLRMIRYEQVNVILRRESYMTLLQYLSKTGEYEQLEELLKNIPYEELSQRERAEVVRCLVLCGNFRAAYQQIRAYGPYFADVEILLKVLDALLSENVQELNAALSAAAMYVFRSGRCSQKLLQYMVRSFKGSTIDMGEIRKAAASYGIETKGFCERIMVQMLFTGSEIPDIMDVLRDYLSGGGRQEIKEAVVTYLAYEYFAKEKASKPDLFGIICQMAKQSENVSRIAKLAYLKYFAENHMALTEETGSVAKAFLQEMVERRIHLNFFREYREWRDLLRDMWDKSILEHRTRPGSCPRMQYRLLQDQEVTGEEQNHYLHEVCPGVYFDEYVLFFGESLQYTIWEDVNGEEKITAGGLLQKNDTVDGTEGGKFELINQMLISQSLQDSEALEQQMQEYFRREFMGEELFVLSTE